MKKSTIFAMLLIAVLAIVSFGVEAQTIETPDVSVTFSSTDETATVVLKSVSITRAINELCEQGINSKTNSVLLPGMWEVSYDVAGYTPKKAGVALEGSPFKAKSDAVKQMKLAMKEYYAVNKSLASR